MLGLLDLPTELLVELPQYYPVLHCPLQADVLSTYLANDYTGVDTLCALAQTCVRLRHVFQPILWQNIYVCPGRSNDIEGAEGRMKTDETLAALRRVKDMHVHVRSLTVSLHECTETNRSPAVELVRFLQCIPRLRTLIITGTRTRRDIDFCNVAASMLGISLEQMTFPSVTELTTDTDDIDLMLALKSFPSLTTLNFGDGRNHSITFHLIAEYCPHIEILRNIGLPRIEFAAPHLEKAPEFVLALYKYFPKLRCLSLSGSLSTDSDGLGCMVPLGFQRLEQLTLRHKIWVEFDPVAGGPTTTRGAVADQFVEDLIAVGKEILGTSSTKKQRVLRVEVKNGIWKDNPQITNTIETFYI
ncbi:hypothetical protein MIND_01108700 [Mycena indigotica]|uniref:Uncharacterized protein n=1 Tax=Mycena indigotica TaxID=2126181 RepID=A0A8H6SA76_9AGAR|nr:uncharacterized protein MIND_01108700 [Mycena indigotica]KAF7295684.1 hypothetical protein MIND_01108700 [Mycena indigotica]